MPSPADKVARTQWLALWRPQAFGMTHANANAARNNGSLENITDS